MAGSRSDRPGLVTGLAIVGVLAGGLLAASGVAAWPGIRLAVEEHRFNRALSSSDHLTVFNSIWQLKGELLAGPRRERIRRKVEAFLEAEDMLIASAAIFCCAQRLGSLDDPAAREHLLRAVEKYNARNPREARGGERFYIEQRDDQWRFWYERWATSS